MKYLMQYMYNLSKGNQVLQCTSNYMHVYFVSTNAQAKQVNLKILHG